MSSAPQMSFDKNGQLMSSGASSKYFQLLARVRSQATSKVEYRTFIEDCVDLIAGGIHCDCVRIALLHAKGAQSSRKFALRDPPRDGRIRQLLLICGEEARWLSQVVELRQSVFLTGNESESEISFFEQIAARIAIAIENSRAHDQILALKEQLDCERVYVEDEILAGAKFEEIVGSSEPLLQALGHVARVAPTESTVLVTGESGTGKELIARAIHKRSRRADRPFICVNCAAIPQSLIASELFGHEKGAFTGATERRLGRFELANGGTIFLDEIGDTPPDTQIALLRVLQEREFERVGGGRTVSVDVRVVAASNRDLKPAVEAGTFRLDLFYRLSVFPVRVPSLRERKDDIPLLAKYFIDRYARSAGKKIKNIDRKTLELLQAYDWPGNIRELQNVIERAVILCDGATISISESSMHRETFETFRSSAALNETLLNTEREMIEAALEECRGRVSGPSGAAEKLGIPRSTLESRIRSLRIDKHLFRSERCIPNRPLANVLSTGRQTHMTQP